MSEDDYLALVTRLQQAMCIEPFRPSLIDVMLLASEWRMHSTEIERLLVDNAELSAECDQWQAKLAEVWAELAELRAREPNGA